MSEKAENTESLIEAIEASAAEKAQRLSDQRDDVVAMAAEAVRDERGEDSVPYSETPEDLQSAERTAEESEQTAEESERAPEASEEPKAEKPEGSLFLRETEDGEQVVVVTVDGEDKILTLEEAQAELQKRISGDERLAAAAQLRDEAEQRARAAQEFVEQQARAAQTAPQDDVTDDYLLEISKGIVGDIESGEDDAAAQKLAAALKKSRGASPATPAAPATTVITAEQRAQMEAQVELNRQYNEFAGEYQDVVNDPTNYALADTLSEQIAREHEDWEPLRVMREAGDQVRRLRGTETPSGQPEVNVSGNQARENRRFKLKPVPGTGAAENIQPADRSGPRTLEDVINNMNIQRRGSNAPPATAVA